MPDNLEPAQRDNLERDSLPELPKCAFVEYPKARNNARTACFTAEQMRSYAAAAVAQERERLIGMRPTLIRLAEAVEAAGYKRGLDRRATSDYEPEICALVNAIDAAIRKGTT